MSFTNPSPEYPATTITDSDIGLQNNRASFRLDGQISDSATNLTVQEDISEMPNSGILTIEDERILYTNKNDGTKEFQSLTRGYDGSSAASHADGTEVNANVVAFHHNKLLAEVQAIQSELGISGGSTTLNRNITLRPSTTGGQYPLTVGVLSGHSVPEPLIDFERSTDGGTSYSSVGSIDYDPSNDELEFSNITLTAGTSSNILLEDDRLLHFGTDSDTSIIFDSGDSRTEIRGDTLLRVEDANSDLAWDLDPTTGNQTVPGIINLSNSSSIQDAGTDAITFDGSQNVAIPNGSLTLQSAGSLVLPQSTADYTVSWNDPSSARALTIPDPGGGATFAFIDAAQTISASNTYTANQQYNDDVQIQLGSAAGGDWVWEYESANTRVRLHDGTNTVLDVDDGTTTLDAGGDLNFRNSDNIQDAGTDAIQFDGNRNVTISNGNLTANNNILTDTDASNDIGANATRWNNVYQEFARIDQLIELTPISEPAHSDGQLFYDTDLRTLSFHNDQSSVTVNIGEENAIRVTNKSGSQIDNGDVVYIDGFNANSAVPTIQLAKADAQATAQADGMATQDIPDDSVGYITTTGAVRGLDTSSFNNGDRLFLSDTTAGAFTTTEPSAPNFSINVGRVARASNGNGIILVDFGETREALFTQGSVPFANSNGRLIEDSTNLTWDNSNDILTAQNITVPSGGDLTLGQSTADITVQWNDPGAARTYTIPDTGSNDTFLFESRTLTGGNAIDAIGDLSQDRTIAVSSNSIQTDELDLSISPTWTGDHDFDGSVTRVVNTITGDGSATTIASSDHFVPVDTSSNSETVNLPASPSNGEEHVIRRDGSNDVTIDGNGNNIQEGTSANSTFTLGTDGQRVRLIWDGTNWKGAD